MPNLYVIVLIDFNNFLLINIIISLTHIVSYWYTLGKRLVKTNFPTVLKFQLA